jgi:hypothetical protein
MGCLLEDGGKGRGGERRWGGGGGGVRQKQGVLLLDQKKGLVKTRQPVDSNSVLDLVVRQRGVFTLADDIWKGCKEVVYCLQKEQSEAANLKQGLPVAEGGLESS